MDSQNNDKQGCGNTIFNINHVENLINGDVETLNNTHNEGEVKKSKPSSDDNVNKGNRLQRQMEIMQYVSNLKEFVAKEWQSRYDDLWKTILEDTEVACVIYDPGKQQNTTFNRKLVANIIYEPTLKSKACLKCLYFTIIIFDLCRYLEYFSYLYTINLTE